MNPMLTNCPVCEGPLLVNRLVCPNCETTIEGSFQPADYPRQVFTSQQAQALAPFAKLSVEQIQFLITFVSCDGNFKQMKDKLGISYPTLRSRMNEILRTLGYEPAREDAPVMPTEDDRRKILDELSAGNITAVEAAQRLKGITAAATQAVNS